MVIIECRYCEAFFADKYRGGDSCSGTTECRRHAPVGKRYEFPLTLPWNWCMEFIPRTRPLGQPPRFRTNKFRQQIRPNPSQSVTSPVPDSALDETSETSQVPFLT
jgi:hypothetical protein